jgi:polyketide synthase PksN
MRQVLQYIIQEVKAGRLSKPFAVELTKTIGTQASKKSFARERYWVEPVEGVDADGASASVLNGTASGAVTDVSRLSGDASEAFELLTFEEVWEAQALPAAGLGNPMRRLVCFLSDAESRCRVVEALKERAPQMEVIFVAQDGADPGGDALDQAYRVVRGERASYRQALSRIWTEHGEADAVLYLWALEDTTCLEDSVAVVHLLQGLASSGLKCGRLLLAGAYGDGLERCHLESWIGFERSLSLVFPQTRVAVIGQEAGLSVEQWLPRLWGELQVEKIESAFYREGKREVCRVRPRALEESEIPLRMGGTYLISGGFGGLGLLVAEHLARKWAANLVLTGRSELDDAKRRTIAALKALGGAVLYAQADVCDRGAMEEALRAGEERFGALHGVIHAAGVSAIGSVFEKDAEHFNAVVAPKVTGTLVLDEVFGSRTLDFVCYFSSSSALLGDFGACDYAIGNRFLMAHAYYRNELQGRGERGGKVAVINWGLWQDGGMGVGGSEQTRMYLKSSGQRALSSSEGIELFERLLGQAAAQHLVLAGQPSRVHRFLGLGPTSAGPGVAAAPLAARTGRYQGGRAELKGLSVAQCVMWELKRHASELLKLPRERLDDDENLADFGFDSIGLAEFARRLTQQFGVEFSPSVFFSYPTLAQLMHYFVEVHPAAVETLYQEVQQEEAPASLPAVASLVVAGGRIEAAPLQPQEPRGRRLTSVPALSGGVPEPIAIIGMSGRFPKARTVDELWQILANGEDAVEEIPADRFNWRKYYGDPQAEAGKIDCKWGGFVPGVGEFDPLFFEISPREAELMDPRQRLLLMESWKALEDAGYGPIQLGRGKVGMFVGVEGGDYQVLTRGGGSITANHDGILASRLGYFLNMRGPAMAINTACSSGLVALHQACSSLRNGECDTALAAGATLILTPLMYIGTSQAGMLSKDGKCHAFDRDANGMVPGEAVAVVVLKLLSQAEADGDPIHAVIRGSGINYDGKTNGITAPSGASQSSLLQEVYERYGVNPEEIEYIVTHGTGTRLGDPVEINALSEAFKGYTRRQGFCALTSSKTNFGHTLAASGLVSLIGLVQSLRHQSIPASLHCAQENDYIDWQGSPFYVNKANKAWPEKPDGRRLGAVSAFGMSGTNAHAVVESYRQEQASAPLRPPCYLLVLSAKTAAALQARIDDLIPLLEQPDRPAPDLLAMSHTLLCGRQHFSHRCAIVVEDREAALYGLRLAARGERQPNLFSGTVARHFTGQKALQLYGDELLARCDVLLSDEARYQETLCALADLYCQGYELAWQSLHPSATPHRVSLPTYPFARERYWVEPAQPVARSVAAGENGAGSVLHPLLHRNTSDLSGLRFTTRLSGDEFYLRDYMVHASRILPSAAHLEMARAAVAAASGDIKSIGLRLQELTWESPVVVDSESVDLHVELLTKADGKIAYEIYTDGKNERVAHSRGRALLGAVDDLPIVDIADVKARCNERSESAADYYAALAALGLDHGSSHRVVTQFFTGRDEAGHPQVLAQLVLPSSAMSMTDYVLHPCVLEGALQARIALRPATPEVPPVLSLPIAIEEVIFFSGCPVRGWAWIRSRSRATDHPAKIDIDVCDDDGRVFAKLRGLVEAILPSVVNANLAESTDLTAEMQAALIQWMSEFLKVPARDIDTERELTQYGLDSIGSTQLVNRLNQAYGLGLAPTIFYKYATLADFTRYLVKEHGTAFGRPVRYEFTKGSLPSFEPLSQSKMAVSAPLALGIAMNGAHASFINGLSLNSREKPLGKQQRNGEAKRATPILHLRPRPALLPLSCAQERLLLIHRQQDVGSAYNLPAAIKLSGPLDTAALHASLAEVARRHESLRTRFATVDGRNFQMIEPSLVVELPIFDLENLPDNERIVEARQLAGECLRRPFSLDIAPLFRVNLIRLCPTEHMLVIVAHHIVSDGWSMEVFVREISTLYTVFSRGLPSPLPDLPIQYADYAIWQGELVKEWLLDSQLDYWIDRLANAPILNLPTDRPRPPTSTYRGSTVLFSLPEKDVVVLRSLAQRQGATLFMVLFAAFNIVISRFSEQKDIVIGTPVAGRQSLEVENVIGFFINMLALRTNLSGEPTFRELLERVKETTLSALAHQDLPLAEIEAAINSVRDTAPQPLFRILFGLQKVSPIMLDFFRLEVSPVLVENDTSRRDQSFFVYETADGLFGIFEYATDIFDTSTIEGIVSEFRGILYQVIADPDFRITARRPADAAVATQALCLEGMGQ